MLASTAMLMTCQTLQLLISQVIIFALGVLVALEIRSCKVWQVRSEEHTSELQSHSDLVCRLLLVKKARTRLSHRYHGASRFDWLLVNGSLPQDYERHCIENNLAFLGRIGAKPLLPCHDYELYLSP